MIRIELFTYARLAFAHNSTRTPAHVAQFKLINCNGFVISKCVTMTNNYDGKNGSLACAHALVRCSLHSHSATGRPDRQRRISESALDRRPRFRFSALRQQIPSMSFKFQQLNRDSWRPHCTCVGTRDFNEKKRNCLDWIRTVGNTDNCKKDP